MAEVSLTIWSDGQSQQLPLAGARVTIGRGEQADVRLSDQGLSRVHASLNQDAARVWVLDEGSTNGTFVNGQRVPASGTVLKNGDQISLGDTTKIALRIGAAAKAQTAGAAMAAATNHNPSGHNPSGNASAGIPVVPVAIAAVVVIGILATVTAVGWQMRKGKQKSEATEVVQTFTPEPVPTNTPAPTPSPSFAPTEEAVVIDESANLAISDLTVTTVKASQISVSNTKQKLYKQMSEEEQVYYINQKAQKVALMVGNRPAVFPDEAISIIKYWLDAYVRRIGSGNTRLWAEDLRFMFKRARTQFVPTILRAFKANGAPPVVGIYLPVIETEYRNIPTENFAGAAGLFQFIGPTARGYGVDPAERTNIEKMAPAAARYINDRLAEFGADAVGVGLSIAGYNRSPDSVRRDLHDVIDSSNKDRDFWILVKNKAKLDHWFQQENINYVPRFFAAAIIGEHPWDFGLNMRQLSTYTEPDTSSDE
ncbi:MAG: FHA domain-containing protein [Blastocatellia bacterium]|nr:FHA domain-containing protein [Blastocatellia bacterium]